MIIYLQMIETDADKDKFVQIYKKYKKQMLFVAQRILGNPHDAEDAVHQAFLSIIENFEKISEIECPETRAYIVIITERKALDIIRSNQKYAAEYVDQLGGIEFSMPNDHGLRSALARLPARYREVLLLRFSAGYSTKELAELFEMNHASVQKLIWRAKEALAEELEKEGEAHG